MPNKRRRTFIKEWRNFRDLSQEDLAGLIDMSKGNLSLLERGLINYTQDTLDRISKALDCSVLDLLSRDPADSENLFELWDRASPANRATLIEIGRTILKDRSA